MKGFRVRAGLLVLVFVLVFPLAGSIKVGSGYTQPNDDPPIFGETWARTEMFFGRSKPDGSMVTDEEFDQFLADEITSRFPDGLTVLFGIGQFRGSSGVITRENSIVLIILYPLTDAGASDRLEEIRTAYKTAFQQEAVLRVDSRAGVSF